MRKKRLHTILKNLRLPLRNIYRSTLTENIDGATKHGEG